MNKPNKNKHVDTKNTVAVVVTGGDGEWLKWVKGSTVCGHMENKFLVVTTAAYMASQVGESVKNSPASAGDTRNLGSTPGSGRSPGEGNGNSLQYYCLGKSQGQKSLAG